MNQFVSVILDIHVLVFEKNKAQLFILKLEAIPSCWSQVKMLESLLHGISSPPKFSHFEFQPKCSSKKCIH